MKKLIENQEKLMKLYLEDQDIKNYYKRIKFQLKWIDKFKDREV